MIAKVVSVDIDNKFIFEGNTYKICDSVTRYRVTDIPERNNAEMDVILVVTDRDKIWFLDENMDKIKNKFITKLD